MTDSLRLKARAAELSVLLVNTNKRGDPAPDDLTAVAAGVLAFEPAHQQPALAALVANLCPNMNAGAALAGALTDELTTTGRELAAALAMVRSGASLLIGYKPSDLIVAAVRDVIPDGAVADDDGKMWATWKPGARRMVVALRNDPHLNANTGRAMRAADPKTPTPTLAPTPASPAQAPNDGRP